MQIRLATLSDVSAIAKVHVDAWRTTYQGILPVEYLASLSYQQREAMWAQAFAPTSPSVVYVVETAEGQISGFAAGGPERENDPIYAGEIYAIYLLQSTQRRGTGRQLFTTLATHLAQTGLKGLLVWVAAANPSRHFYAALGGKPIKEKSDMIGGVEVVEIAYGWEIFS